MLRQVRVSFQVLQRRHELISCLSLCNKASISHSSTNRLASNDFDISKDDSNHFQKSSRNYIAGLFGALAGAGVFIFSLKYLKVAQASTIKNDTNDGPARPIYTKAEVSKHKTTKDRIWVTYLNGVYDITDFVNLHPGGSEKIMLAAGGSLEPFWALYAVHKKEEVLEILEELRVGDLDPKDVQDSKSVADAADPFANDPPRHPALIVQSQKPFNAETPPSLLTDNFVTPNELFFVRNHLPVPLIDDDKYELEIGGKGMTTKKYKLKDLKSKFKQLKVTAALQCAGNRRNEMNPIKVVKGLTWTGTAISNAEWTGVSLRDVLIASGVDKSKVKLEHVQFEGLDTDVTGQRYGASIELDRAMNGLGDVILAYEMNGMPLPLDHGYPLRVVVPGVVGARNVKWLSKIFVSDMESDSHWQQNDYKSFSPSVDWDTVDFKSAPAIQEAPVQSAICSPLPGQKMPKGAKEIEVKGYAWSGGGRGIIRVDVSVDGGKTWSVAELNRSQDQKLSRMWSWTLWTCKVPIPEGGAKNVNIICKATDISYNAQPDHVEGIWNLRGVLNNAWHRVNVELF